MKKLKLNAITLTNSEVLTRAQLKNVLGGNRSATGSGSCLEEFDYACSISGAGNPEDQCCPGLKCEMNATDTGTICVNR